ncbi:MAG: ABC transporter substrate-binding protein, partial [Actinomycetota bacterium]
MPLRALRLGLAVLLLSACGLVDGDDAANEKDVFPGSISVGLPQIGAIDPPRAASPSALTLIRTACDQLTGTDADTGMPAPTLAAKWTFAPGATKLSIRLRAARFQDGSAVTAEAVREALSRVARPSTASPWAPLVSRVAGFPEVQSQAATNLSGIKITGRNALEIQL